jgi:hypothetical protein
MQSIVAKIKPFDKENRSAVPARAGIHGVSMGAWVSLRK